MRPLPGHFIHGVDLDDWYPCYNLALSGRLLSPDFLAVVDPGVAATHRRIRDTPLEELRDKGLPVGAPTPRATWCVFAAAIARSGGRVGIGTTHTQWFSTQEAESFRKRGDIELAFEESRRSIAPDAPSRLSSLYVAEDSEAGRTHVRRMLGKHIHIVRVSVPVAARAHRGDTAWFDHYCLSPNPAYIENYWRSEPAGSDSGTWEILVDGVVQVDDAAGLEHLRKVGAQLTVGRQSQDAV